MSWTSLFLNFVARIAWPLTVLVIAVGFRRQIRFFLLDVKEADLPGGVRLRTIRGDRLARALAEEPPVSVDPAPVPDDRAQLRQVFADRINHDAALWRATLLREDIASPTQAAEQALYALGHAVEECVTYVCPQAQITPETYGRSPQEALASAAAPPELVERVVEVSALARRIAAGEVLTSANGVRDVQAATEAVIGAVIGWAGLAP